MKKTLFLSLFIFWAVLAAILTAGLVFYSNSVNGPQNSGAGNAPGQNSGGQNLRAGPVLSAAEVAKHSSAADCWMIISDKVYNLTSFINIHPGGAATILKYCGKDGTNGFQTKDIGRPHSSTAVNLLADYYLGDLNQVISNNSTVAAGNSSGLNASATTSPSANPPAPTAAKPLIPRSVDLTLAEVSRHNSVSDCWMIISGQVYNFTGYIAFHPGGTQMVPYCGQDATVSFFNGPPHAHSPFAASLLSGYLLGKLNTQATVTLPPQNPSSFPLPVGGEGGGEEGD